MKIVLAGTPHFSVKVFETVINKFDVVAIITQPDKPKGRGLKILTTPVKQLAQRYGIKIFQPKKIKEIEKELNELNYDILLTCAYGQIIPEQILKTANKIALNIHGSILPKYRGAAPIQYSILNGDSKTGISLIKMTNKMDAGDILFTSETVIENSYTSGDMFDILSVLASESIEQWLERISQDSFTLKKQNEKEVSFSPKITKEQCEITKNHTIFEAQRIIKAFNPFPGAFIMKDNKKFKVFNYGEAGIEYKLKDGSIFITEIQSPGKKSMSWEVFLKGNKF
ncbi:MAG: methionyl-tRNA formyltransferase [Mycoplasma sp.]|nr:methionyl-tRNA formyltransferase [Mycoplasma sp.]